MIPIIIICLQNHLTKVDKRMKTIKSLSILLYVLVLMTACKQEKKRVGSIAPKTSSIMVLSQRDTTTVTELVNRFMTLAQNKEYAEAVAMLYKMDAKIPNQAPEPLDNEDTPISSSLSSSKYMKSQYSSIIPESPKSITPHNLFSSSSNK